jgi:tRNA(Ile)-lysidine synthase
LSDQFVSIGAKISVARNESGKIKLRTESKPYFNASELAANLTRRAGELVLGGVKFDWEIRGSRGRSPHRKNFAIRSPQSAIQKEFFDADKIGSKIIVRHWRAGDRFQPIGLKSSAKLQDLFVNAKIPHERRRNLILATTLAGEIFWVENLRISENFKITPQTKWQLIWHWKNRD